MHLLSGSPDLRGCAESAESAQIADILESARLRGKRDNSFGGVWCTACRWPISSVGQYSGATTMPK